ncbi:DUF302 domain-containing protein [Candidatus Parcubacteria bacterium]|nr:MAG: DUF302 domain-containing protein [Candidatus Parcubacteria bacterium]
MEYTEYGIRVKVNLPYEQAVERITAALKEQGFGILTTIDVKETLKKKLDVDFQKYVILGACNPPLAHRALTVNPNIGLLLPCNVIVYEGAEPGQTIVSIVDPLMMVQMAGDATLNEVAAEARQRLEQVVAALAESTA